MTSMPGTKRSASMEVHPSRRSNFDNSGGKRRRPNHFGPMSEESRSLSAYALKEKIRDLTRLLNHSTTMPADVRIEKERALAGYQADFEKVKDSKKKKDIIAKYHMVRFFERQKATRALKKVQKKLLSTPLESEERKAVELEVHEAEVDLNYTMYYPLEVKYQSLYPRTADQGPLNEAEAKELGGKGERKLGGEKPPLWFVVENSMAEGTLEALRDGGGMQVAFGNPRPTQTDPREGPSIPAHKKPMAIDKPAVNPTMKGPSAGKKRNGPGGGGVKLTGGPASDSEDDDLSDGGFFEE